MSAVFTDLQLASQSYQHRSSRVLSERLINLYPEANPSGAKASTTLHGTPGLKSFATCGSGPIRGITSASGLLWVVSGDELYTVDRYGAATQRASATPIPSYGPVSMFADSTHVVVVTRTDTLAFTISDYSVSVLAESSLTGGVYQDGFGVFTQRGTQFIWATDVDDLTTIGGTSFTSADAQPDHVVGLISDHRELWVLKEQTTEIYQNDGGSPFPFVRTQFIERGCGSADSIAKTENAVLWLGDDFRVYAAAGYQPQAISTHPIERLIAGRTAPESCSGFVYRQEGHNFYVLSWSDLTLCYDLVTGRWHERKSDGLDRWRANHHAYAFGKNLVGDSVNGNLHELDLDTYDENGTAFRREIWQPVVDAGGAKINMAELEVDIETGVGLTSGQGSDPQVMVDWSCDGGVTWSNERWKSAGKIGERKRRVRFTRLGTERERILRIAFSDKVKVAVTGARARMELRA